MVHIQLADIGHVGEFNANVEAAVDIITYIICYLVGLCIHVSPSR